MLKSKKTAGYGHDFDTAAAAKLKNAARSDKQTLYQLLESREIGLTEAEVQEKQHQFGPNEVDHEKAPSWYVQLLQAFVNPFIGVLIVIALVSLITDVLMAAPGDRDIPFSPFAAGLKLQPLPGSYFFWLVGILVV